MDASTFYGGTNIQNHAAARRKLDDETAEELLEKIDANAGSSEFTSTSGTPGSSQAVHVQPKDSIASKKFSVKWEAKEFSPTDTACCYRPQGGSVPQEPLVYFSRYFSPQIFRDFAKFTNMYALQRDGTELGTTEEEIKVFFGMLMLMGVLKFPRVRMYWTTATRIPAIAEAMSAKRFFKIGAALHISDSNAPRDPNSQGKFWKVRPVIEAVRQRCLLLEPLEHNSVDEQMIAFTGRVAAKQFVKGKPNPEGVKVFVRCSSDGLAHDYELYQGKGTGVSAQHSHLGLGGSVVMRLVQTMSQGQNLKCFMDNYFSSVKLFLELKEIGILASGTIRANRLLGCQLKTEKQMKTEGRGCTDHKVSKEGDIVLVRWQDNGVVNMASTHVGTGNTGKVKRWSESKKTHIDIDCPDVILQYKYMGGVDKLDFVMSFYPMRTKTKKWTVRVISHFASFSLANSWLEYVRDEDKEKLLKKNTMDMLAFQTDVAHSLITCNKTAQKKRGRPSNESPQPVAKRAHNAEPQSTNTVRYDGCYHWPEHVSMPFAQRCRREDCSSKSRIRCKKCGIFLCLSAQKNCFFLFHTN
ncbi:piggyBac transposable element-derived protein 3 [Ixodes scapularis]|uniref:piggyBac transposable element-derived protein 3 n=1 Tax=Ixodes scapularis TaxID=6945 RepID=UPI001C392684|nr:piggyBac transposable element-derived protein 3 [Ixodes scapularis]